MSTPGDRTERAEYGPRWPAFALFVGVCVIGLLRAHEAPPPTGRDLLQRWMDEPLEELMEHTAGVDLPRTPDEQAMVYAEGAVLGDLVRLVRAQTRPDNLDLTEYAWSMTDDGFELEARGAFDLTDDFSTLRFGGRMVGRWPRTDEQRDANDVFGDRLLEAYKEHGFSVRIDRLFGTTQAGRWNESELEVLIQFETRCAIDGLRAGKHTSAEGSLARAARLDSVLWRLEEPSGYFRHDFFNGARLFAFLADEVDARSARIVASHLASCSAPFEVTAEDRAEVYARLLRIAEPMMGAMNLFGAMGGQDGIGPSSAGRNRAFYEAALDWVLSRSARARAAHHARLTILRDESRRVRGHGQDDFLMHPGAWCIPGMIHDVATLMFAIRAYELEHGDLPVSLDALTDTGILNNLPSDRCAPWQSYRYRIDAESPHGCVVYSVWVDGTDDGMAIDPRPLGEDEWFWSSGYDFPLSRLVPVGTPPEHPTID